MHHKMQDAIRSKNGFHKEFIESYETTEVRRSQCDHVLAQAGLFLFLDDARGQDTHILSSEGPWGQ